MDAGPPWFYPAALIPGVIAAAIFAAVVYVLFLLVYGIRAALHGQPAADASVISTPQAPAVHEGSKRRPRPAPLLLAVGAALVWAVLSVGPSLLAEDFGRLFPKDTTKTPLCPIEMTAAAPHCPSDWRPAVPTFPGEDPACGYVLVEEPNIVQAGVLEADSMCHARSDGTVEPLMNDVLRGGQAGLLAFLAVGAALLIWPRLQKAGTPGA